jgi:hypothetical protein
MTELRDSQLLNRARELNSRTDGESIMSILANILVAQKLILQYLIRHHNKKHQKT